MTDFFKRNAPFVKSGVKDFFTKLEPKEEKEFRKWVKDNKVPFDPASKEPQDYDMRGFYRGLMSGDPHAKTGINPNDKQLHFSDYWKTPYHKSFSNESKFATPDAPAWKGDKLIGKDGAVILDEAAPKQERKRMGNVGFFSHIADGFAHIYDNKGALTKVSAKRLPKDAKPGTDIDVRTSPKGHVRVGKVGASTKTNTAQDRQQYAVQRLMSPGHGPDGKGWSRAQASGMVGRWMQESYERLDTGAVGDKEIPGASHGIGQWNRERKAAMIAYTTGKNPGGKFASHPLVKAALAASPGARGVTNFDAQLDFGDWEIRNSPSERLAFTALSRAKDPEEASAAMMHYERPRHYRPGNPRGGHGFKQTVQYSNFVMSKYDPSYTPDVQVGGGDDADMIAPDPDAAELDTEDPRQFDWSGRSEVASGEIEDEPTLGETLGNDFQENFEAPEEDPARGERRRQGIADMIEQGQQASAGSLPRLPTIEELFSG